MSRWFWVGVIALGDGLLAAWIGTLASSLGGSWMSPFGKQIIRAAFQRSFKFDAVTLASGLAGALCAIPLIKFLDWCGTTSHRWKFVAMSAIAGIVYGYVTACVAAVFIVPLLSFSKELQSSGPFLAVVGTLYGMVLAMFVMGFMSLMLYGPVILIGGTLLGLLNGFLVRRLLLPRKSP